MKRLILSVLLQMAVLHLSAQSFNLSVTFDKAPQGKVTLTIFDCDSVPRMMQKKASRGVATFGGQVSQPCYAEVNTAKGQRLGLFIENSNITVHFNDAEPEASAVTGSRTNSQYRYALEQCRQEDGSYDVDNLAAQVRDNRSSVFAPLLIYKHIMPRCDVEAARELTSVLEGEAKSAYHYRRLHSQSTILSSQHIEDLPDIVFFDSGHKKQHTDSLLTDSTYNLIIVGATWCRQCSNAKEEALRQYKGLNTIVINIDNDKQLWDAEVIRKLQIEHLPYLILVSPDRKKITHDIRPWEIKRLLIVDS